MDIAFARLASSAAKLQGNHVGLKEDFVDLKSGVLKVAPFAMARLPYFHLLDQAELGKQGEQTILEVSKTWCLTTMVTL